MAEVAHISDTIEAEIARGIAAQQSGAWETALGIFIAASRQDPRCAPVYLLLGNALSHLGNWTAAIENYQRAIAIDPDYADAYNNLGIALRVSGREREAIAAHARAAEINPRHANAYFNLGKMCSRHGEYAAAMAMFERTLAIEPRHPYALHELGAVQETCGLLQQAALSYRRSMELDPTRTIRENLASVLALIGDPEGIEQLRQLLCEQPDDAESHWNLGIALLLHGRYAEGWREFEQRIDIPRYREQHHRFDKPRWAGQPLEGKILLLYGEQGYGDTLQFLRYVPLAAQRCSRIVLEVPPLLKKLLERFPGISACTSLGDPKPDFDVYTSLMSLPYLLEPEQVPPPATIPIAESRVQQRKDRDTLRVGLAWAGSAKQKRDHLRSIPLAEWNRLSLIDGIEYTSLQMGPVNPHAVRDGHTFRFVEDCSEAQDFAELATVVAQQDLIITVDTAVAHLSGTLGKPVWILLPNAVDWRWGLHSSTTPWYPTAKLFRQNAPGNWTDPMEKIERALRAMIVDGRHVTH